MSTIHFICNNQEKENLIKGVSSILFNHYFSTVSPNSNVEFDYEGDDVYRNRLRDIFDKLCTFEETEQGVLVEFDSTEDAGFIIAAEVYHTSMGYHDDGLTYIDPIFDSIIEKFPTVLFEADTVCADKWAYEENHYSYDGKTLSKTDDSSEESEEPEDLPQDHFLRTTPRIYSCAESLAYTYNNYNKMLSDVVKKDGKINLKLTVVECTDLNYTVVLIPATEAAIAEASACGYPAEMGAVAFFFVYKRYEGGPAVGDLKAIRAIVKTEDGVGFSEMCTSNTLKQVLNVLYLGIIDVQYYLKDNGKYDEYMQMEPDSQVMLLSADEEKITISSVSGAEIPELEYAPRTDFEFDFSLF